MELENKKICATCPHNCCVKSGCDYFVSDFDDLSRDGILSILETGNVSIVAIFIFNELSNGKKTCEPVLYLRARNVDRGVVDLYSYKKRCSMLRSNGCAYSLENRPSGGVYLIPKEDYKCTSIVNRTEELKKWLSYQKILARVVKHLTGKSVDTLLRENIEDVLVQTLHNDVKGIDSREITDLVLSIKDAIACFPECYERALERSKDVPAVAEKIAKVKSLHAPFKK